jgi:hypothetical protein
VSDSLRNSRAGSRTIYQRGADVNVLFERRVAVVNTQSQHRSRKKWWILTLASCACAGTIGWPRGRTGAEYSVLRSALEKCRSDGKKFVLCTHFFLTPLGPSDGVLLCSDRFPVPSLHAVVPIFIFSYSSQTPSAKCLDACLDI